MYRVIEKFSDLQDDNYRYNVGDKFPRKGKRVSKARFAALASGDNLRGRPVIEEVKEVIDDE